MSLEQQRALRARLIRMIMATDLKDHFEYLSELQDRFEVKMDVAKSLSRAAVGDPLGGASIRDDDTTRSNQPPPGARPDNEKARNIVMQLALKVRLPPSPLPLPRLLRRGPPATREQSGGGGDGIIIIIGEGDQVLSSRPIIESPRPAPSAAVLGPGPPGAAT